MQVRHSFWQNSQCFNSYLHRFSVKEEYPQGVMEECEICRMRKFFKIIDGKLNNIDYMSYHIRQALPQFHERYDHEYSYSPLDDKISSPYVK